jgi:hypothetical protein
MHRHMLLSVGGPALVTLRGSETAVTIEQEYA